MIKKAARLPVVGFREGGAGRRMKTATLLIEWRPNRLTGNRIAVLVRAGAVKKAVDRHRVKRSLAHRAALWPNQGLDILITVHSAPPKNRVGAILEETIPFAALLSSL